MHKGQCRPPPAQTSSLAAPEPGARARPRACPAATTAGSVLATGRHPAHPLRLQSNLRVCGDELPQEREIPFFPFFSIIFATVHIVGVLKEKDTIPLEEIEKNLDSPTKNDISKVLYWFKAVPVLD